MQMEAGWREMDVGEIKREGDECRPRVIRCEDDKRWQQTQEAGEPVQSKLLIYRRRIEPALTVEQVRQIAREEAEKVVMADKKPPELVREPLRRCCSTCARSSSHNATGEICTRRIHGRCDDNFSLWEPEEHFRYMCEVAKMFLANAEEILRKG